jgi:hypothetical protein
MIVAKCMKHGVDLDMQMMCYDVFTSACMHSCRELLP